MMLWFYLISLTLIITSCFFDWWRERKLSDLLLAALNLASGFAASGGAFVFKKEVWTDVLIIVVVSFCGLMAAGKILLDLIEAKEEEHD